MPKTFKILVIEDSEPDFILLQKALNMIDNAELDVHCVKNGQEGLDYIFKEGAYKDKATPDIIILDLNLPIKNGFEVLDTIKKDNNYRTIPIVIYSTSEAKGDIRLSYSLYASSYITKTFDIIELFDKIKHFGNYWTKSVNLPDNE
jgi:CheY-like chemotaxis protein